MKAFFTVLVVAGLAFPALADEASDKLFAAIRNSDLKAINSLLASGSDVNSRDKRGTTPVMYAAAYGSFDAMKLLIDKGAGVNAKSDFGVTALMWAVNDLNKVRLLLDKGADVNAKSKMGRGPLLMAAKDDRGLPVVKLLIDKGADVNARDFMQTTPLIEAANREIAQLLLAKGAGLNAKDAGGFSALMGATSSGDLEWTKMLLEKGADVNAISTPAFGPPVKNGPIALGSFTPLLLAVAYGSPELVKTLIDAGADVNAKDVRGMTPLMLAIGCDHNDARVVKLLLDKGADPKIKSKAGEDALAWAKKAGDAEVLRVFGMKETAHAMTKPVVIPADYAQPDIEKAAGKSIGLLQTSTSKFLVEGGCASCHAHSMTAMAVALARRKGIHVDEAAAAAQLKAVKFGWSTFEQPILQRLDPPGSSDMTAYALLGMEAGNLAPEAVTDAMVFNLAAEQLATGQWHVGGIARPPMEDGDFTRTAISIRSLQIYGMPGRKAEIDDRIARAQQWLISAQPRTTEDRNMQMLGLKWAGADPSLAGELSKKLLELQQPDGGWAQTRDLASDAYATGQTLYALNAAGVSATDPAYRRGVAYLLKTQLPDGSWHVASRAPKFQPYFQSGFPHDHDQWISSAATAWAAMALTAAGAGHSAYAAYFANPIYFQQVEVR
ncbi:MAG: ankyrin repeat domain-containing protein [Bryobacteraceae bacterium]